MDKDHFVGHVASMAAIIGSLIGWLPALAAGFAIVWYALQIYESKTVQWFISRWK